METKKIVGYSMYLIPGYGVYKEVKKPKEKRSKLGVIGSTFYGAFFLLKALTIPSYVGAGIKTNEWNPVDHIKNIFTSEKESGLEKTILYEEALKEKHSKTAN